MNRLKRFQSTGFDLRIAMYQAVRLLIVATVIAFSVKYLLVDTVRMSGSQMTPTILPGDRLLVYRFPFIPLFNRFFKPPYDRAVVYRNGHGLNVLRVVAASGDTIAIDSGKIASTALLPLSSGSFPAADGVIPEDYAPRDFFDTYRVPDKGTMLIMNRLSLRDLFFAADIIRQEHPDDSVRVKPYLMLDDSLYEQYHLTDFMFYNGSIDTVPDTLRNNWFFWNRLEEYLYQKFSDRKVSLYFTVQLDGVDIEEYRVKSTYYFLIADNRKNGLDSRYIGPVRRSRCLGRITMVLWSHGRDENGKWHFRFNRLGRFIP